MSGGSSSSGGSVATTMTIVANNHTNVSSCDPFRLWPSAAVCSGNGDCIHGVCVCYHGYSGYGEFIDRSGRDCNVNEWAVRSMHIIGVLVAIWLFAHCLRNHYRALKHSTSHHNHHQHHHHHHTASAHPTSDHTTNNGSPPAHQRAQSIHPTAGSPVAAGATAAAVAVAGENNYRMPSQQLTARRRGHASMWSSLLHDTASRVSIPILILSLSCLGYHLIRLVQPTGTELVNSWLTTMILFWCPLGYWSGSSGMSFILIKHTTSGMTTSGGAQRAQKTIDQMRLVMMLSSLIGAVEAPLLIWNRTTTAEDDQIIAMMIYYLSIGVAGACIGACVIHHGRRLLKQIDSLKDSRLDHHRKQLAGIIDNFKKATGNAIFTVLLISFWPWLRSYTAYLTPFLLIHGNVNAVLAVSIFSQSHQDRINNHPNNESTHNSSGTRTIHVATSNGGIAMATGANGGAVNGITPISPLGSVVHARPSFRLETSPSVAAAPHFYMMSSGSPQNATEANNNGNMMLHRHTSGNINTANYNGSANSYGFGSSSGHNESSTSPVPPSVPFTPTLINGHGHGSPAVITRTVSVRPKGDAIY